MFRMRLLAAASVALVASGCLLEPDIFCDDTRVSWGFENHEISPADDVSADPGLQIDVVLFSALPEGKPAVLTITDEDGVETVHPETSAVDADGNIRFSAVEVPVGEVLFTMRTANDCREIETRNRRFVLDEQGPSVCELSFTPPTREIAGLAPLRSWTLEDDQEPLVPLTQVGMTVATGREGMLVRLLILDRDSGDSSVVERPTDANGEAAVSVSLDQGELAVRALCTNGPNDIPQSTATFPILVDTVLPDCELIEPSNRVTAGDDLDGNSANGLQVLAVAQTSDASAVGLEATFTVNGGEPEPATIGAAGQSTLVITVPDGPGAQDISIEVPDLAGNRCNASVSF